MTEQEEQQIEPKEEKPPVQYVLVRKDLDPYVQMVHVGHACGESIRTAPISKRTIIRLLHVANEAELMQYHDKLVAKGFHLGLVREPDPPYNDAAMALSTEPLTERVSAVSKVVFHLKPARGSDATREALRDLIEAASEFEEWHDANSGGQIFHLKNQLAKARVALAGEKS